MKFLAFLLTCSTIITAHNVLVVGGGAREQAIAYALSKSPQVNQIFIAPGNAGTASLQKSCNIPIAPTDIAQLCNFAQEQNVTLSIIGPEAPLADGIVNRFSDAGLACAGPTQQAAQLETSKSFAKAFMTRHTIPTAPYASFSSFDEAKAYILKQDLPLVIKADGLMQGKGVFIAKTRTEAMDAAQAMLDGAFGTAGRKIVIEQFLHGTEVSFVVVSDGKSCVPLATAQDYKLRNDDNTGPMTGGMGAVSPAPGVSPELHERVMQEIVNPTIAGMRAEGSPFIGFLYAGLMITLEGNPYVLEFNCRLGDPETQVVLSRLKSDFFKLAYAAVTEQLGCMQLDWDPRSAVGVVISGPHYPVRASADQPITIGSVTSSRKLLFHAGTRWSDDQLVTAGGRLITACGLGASLKKARQNAYDMIHTIQIPGMHYRTDIGKEMVSF